MKTIGELVLTVGLMVLMIGCGSEESDFADQMLEEHKGDAPVENAASELDQKREVSGEEVVYATVDGNKVTGYLATPEDGGEDNPGIIVIHEWWGLNDNIRMMTDKLAGEGYTALAVDLYNGNVAESPENAKKYMSSVNQDAATDNISQAYKYLAEEQDADDVGVIGWCFGGGWSLRAALSHPDKIDATVIYYGQLVTDTEQLEKLDMPVLGIFGAEDESIPPEQVNKFESALNEADVTNSIHIYEKAGHAFANPSGTRYVEDAAEDAWQKTIAFLEEHLK